MFFILSKTIFYIMMPIIWVLFFITYAVFTKNQKRRKQSIITALILLIFFSNNFIINEALSLWEKEPVAISSLNEYETAIVLTGITNLGKESNDKVYFGKGADRLLHTVQLFKLGKIKNILITGGSSSIINNKIISEATQLKSVFIYCGVPEKNIILETKARNTHENAAFTKKIIDSLQLRGKFLLITSAFHMRRAEDCFKKAGINADTYSVDFYTIDRKYTPDKTIIPSIDAFNKWSILIHEITGYIVYKLVGYC